MSTASTAGAAIGPPQSTAPSGLTKGPIVPTLLKLALPTTLVLVVQTLVGVVETYLISFLGTDALAGATLVFPILMLMQMVSNGGIGGGVAAAVARAVGSGRRQDADALIWHAVVLAVAFGVIFTAAAWLFGPALYATMGGGGAALEAAILYSAVVFAGSVPIWITAVLSSALRGAGNVVVPAAVIMAGVGILIPLSALLIFGWGPVPSLGVAGGGAAVVIYYVLAAAVLAWYLRSSRSPLNLRPARLEFRLFKDILGVGLLAAVGAVQVNLTVTLVTAAVGQFGAAAIVGYGIASRLDYIQIPLIFGIGTALVTMVGVNLGAGQLARARRIAWTGAAISLAATAGVSLFALLAPGLWIGLFSQDPEVIEMAALYLGNVAPTYGAVGFGMALYFASQGAGRVLLLVLAGTMRMLIAAFVGWGAVTWLGASLSNLFQIVALSSLVYGLLTAVAVARDRWGRSKD